MTRAKELILAHQIRLSGNEELKVHPEAYKKTISAERLAEIKSLKTEIIAAIKAQSEKTRQEFEDARGKCTRCGDKAAVKVGYEYYCKDCYQLLKQTGNLDNYATDKFEPTHKSDF